MAVEERKMMSKQEVDRFMDRWLNDPAFSAQLKSNPKAALEACGINPDPGLIEALSSIDPATPVEELQNRLSKSIGWN